MGRIKQGLDYFPMSTSFMHDRIVRRVMKREGDAAFATLVETLSYIYAGKGYYIPASDEFYDELTDSLYNTDRSKISAVHFVFVLLKFRHQPKSHRLGINISAGCYRIAISKRFRWASAVLRICTFIILNLKNRLITVTGIEHIKPLTGCRHEYRTYRSSSINQIIGIGNAFLVLFRPQTCLRH